MNIHKPNHLPKYDLIAIKGVYESALEPQDPDNRTFNLSEIAVNTIDQKVQVYVTSHTKKGLADFKRLYPNAEIRKDASLDNPNNWKILCFIKETRVDEEPIDSFFRGHNKLQKLRLEKEAVKARRARRK